MRNRLGGDVGEAKTERGYQSPRSCWGIVNQAALGQLQRELDSWTHEEFGRKVPGDREYRPISIEGNAKRNGESRRQN